MQTFAIAPAEIRALWLIGILILVVLVPVAVIFGTVMSGAHGARFEVSPLSPANPEAFLAALEGIRSGSR
jgi:hypothetical protein